MNADFSFRELFSRRGTFEVLSKKMRTKKNIAEKTERLGGGLVAMNQTSTVTREVNLGRLAQYKPDHCVLLERSLLSKKPGVMLTSQTNTLFYHKQAV